MTSWWKVFYWDLGQTLKQLEIIVNVYVEHTMCLKCVPRPLHILGRLIPYPMKIHCYPHSKHEETKARVGKCPTMTVNNGLNWLLILTQVNSI